MPCSYEFRLRVALSPRGDLILTSRIKNISSDSKPFQFTFAYHTYFSVSDIRYLVKCHLFALCLHQIIFGVSYTLWVQSCIANKKTCFWVMLNLSPSDSIRLQIFKKKGLCTRNCLSFNRNLTITTLPFALSIGHINTANRMCGSSEIYMDHWLLSVPITWNMFLHSVKWGLKVWRPWTILKTCNLRIVVLNKEMQLYLSLK